MPDPVSLSLRGLQATEEPIMAVLPSGPAVKLDSKYLCDSHRSVMFPTLVREASFCNGQQLIQRLKIGPRAENKRLWAPRPNQRSIKTAPLPGLRKHHGRGSRKNAVTGAWEEWHRMLSGHDIIAALLSSQQLMTTADQDNQSSIQIWAGLGCGRGSDVGGAQKPSSLAKALLAVNDHQRRENHFSFGVWLLIDCPSPQTHRQMDSTNLTQ